MREMAKELDLPGPFEAETGQGTIAAGGVSE
jgi:hypothetical protein